jgi:hypothetical protein
MLIKRTASQDAFKPVKVDKPKIIKKVDQVGLKLLICVDCESWISEKRKISLHDHKFINAQ